MATKSAAQSGRFGSFVNSPGFGKFFKAVLIVLILLAAAYGGYTVYKQNFSHAASSGPWKYNSPGITHEAGSAKIGNLYTQGVLDSVLGTGATGPVWYGDSLAGAANKYVWNGPGIHLHPDRQYLGCFVYRAKPISTSQEDNGVASLDVYDSSGSGKIYNTYWVSNYVNYSNDNLRGNENITRQTDNKGNFARTCLAFFIPQKATGNRISLRVKLYTGRIAVKQTQITQVNASNYNLPSLKLLQARPDNSTILQGANYK